MRIDRRALLAAACALSVLGGCGDPPARDGAVHLGAAASLRRVLPALIDAYAAEHPEAAIEASYAGSGTIRAQAEAGAPIDAVLLASDQHLDLLVARGVAKAEARVVVARNVLVLVGGSDSPATSIAALPELPSRARLAIGAPDSAPVGRYARDLLQARGLWDALQSRLVHARDVSAVVAYVRRGEAAAGFAYATDVRGVEGVRVLERADGAEDPAPLVVGAVLAEAPHEAAARAFLAWLAEPAAREVLAAHGFQNP